jgi:hypothetical protein
MTGQGGLLPHPPPHFCNVAVVYGETDWTQVMRQRSTMQPTVWKSRVTMLTACLIAAAAGAAVLRTDVLLGLGLGSALRQSGSELSFDTAQATSRGGVAVGDEGYWLTRASTDSSSPFAKPLLVGDRIAISSAGSDNRQFEVTAIKALGADATVDGNLAPGRLMLVVCRLIDTSGRDQRTVRFIVEMPPADAAPAMQPKAL